MTRGAAPPPACPEIAGHVDARRTAALHTLLGGAAFVDRVAQERWVGTPWPDDQRRYVRARYLANCLFELNRFLHVLIDASGTRPQTARPATRRAAAPLIPSSIAGADAATSHERLIAIDRSRACLRHCAGRVRRADRRGGETMTAGWIDPATTRLRVYRIGEDLCPTGADLRDVAGFYRTLAYRVAPAALPGDDLRAA